MTAADTEIQLKAQYFLGIPFGFAETKPAESQTLPSLPGAGASPMVKPLGAPPKTALSSPGKAAPPSCFQREFLRSGSWFLKGSESWRATQEIRFDRSSLRSVLIPSS